MKKLLSKFKAVLLVFLALAVIPVFTGANCDKNTVETPLSEADKDVLKYTSRTDT